MNDRRFQLVKTAAGFELDIVREEPPMPGPGEVLIQIHAASEIAAIGPGVTRFAVGDWVCSTFSRLGRAAGAFGKVVIRL